MAKRTVTSKGMRRKCRQLNKTCDTLSADLKVTKTALVKAQDRITELNVHPLIFEAGYHAGFKDNANGDGIPEWLVRYEEYSNGHIARTSREHRDTDKAVVSGEGEATV